MSVRSRRARQDDDDDDDKRRRRKAPFTWFCCCGLFVPIVLLSTLIALVTTVGAPDIIYTVPTTGPAPPTTTAPATTMPAGPPCDCVNETLAFEWFSRDEGVAIAQRPSDGRIFYITGGGGVEPKLIESYDTTTSTLDPPLVGVGTGIDQEAVGLVYYPPLSAWVVTERLVPGSIWTANDDFTVWSVLGPHPGGGSNGMRGLALVNETRLFAVDPFVDELWELDTVNWNQTLQRIPLTFGPTTATITGANGITHNPVDDTVNILYRVPGAPGSAPRQVGIVDVDTGIVTPTCLVLTETYSAIVVDTEGTLWLAAGNSHPVNFGLFNTTYPCAL